MYSLEERHAEKDVEILRCHLYDTRRKSSNAKRFFSDHFLRKPGRSSPMASFQIKKAAIYGKFKHGIAGKKV